MKKNAWGLARINDSMVEEGKTYEVMGIPERLKALFTDHLMGSSVHQEHDQEHPVYQHSSLSGR
jgi:hypothetical protein